MTQVNFADLRQRVHIEQVATQLGLKLKPHGVQYRSSCPICNDKNERALVITPAKGLFFCFSCKQGGDAITLVSKVKNISLRDAALFLDTSAAPAPPAAAPAKAPTGFDPGKYANTLDPCHASLEPLGVSSETLREWRAGYASTGVHRGKLALPVTRDGKTVAYIGRTLKDETPRLSFANGTNPQDFIFGEDRVGEGPLQLVRDPIDVIRAHEGGMSNVIAFLTETITPQQLEQLAALMDRAKCESVEVF